MPSRKVASWRSPTRICISSIVLTSLVLRARLKVVLLAPEMPVRRAPPPMVPIRFDARLLCTRPEAIRSRAMVRLLALAGIRPCAIACCTSDWLPLTMFSASASTLKAENWVGRAAPMLMLRVVSSSYNLTSNVISLLASISPART